MMEDVPITRLLAVAPEYLSFGRYAATTSCPGSTTPVSMETVSSAAPSASATPLVDQTTSPGTGSAPVLSHS